MRRDILVKPEAVDPSVGEAGSRYLDYDDELIARSLILTETWNVNRPGHSESYLEKSGKFEQSFRTDARRVWQLHLPIFKDHSAYVHFKAGLKTKNSRVALRAATAHYLGDSMMDYHANAYEQQLQTMQYLGEQKNFNFDKCSSRMLELHQLLDGLKEHGHGYSGIDEHTKVRYFL